MPSVESGKRPQNTQIVRSDALAAIPWLVHGFSTRQGGVSEAYGGGALNLGITKEDTREAVAQNRRLFLAGIGAVNGDGSPWPSVNMRQVHSSVIHRIEKTDICQTRADVGHPQIWGTCGRMGYLGARQTLVISSLRREARHEALGLLRSERRWVSCATEPRARFLA